MHRASSTINPEPTGWFILHKLPGEGTCGGGPSAHHREVGCVSRLPVWMQKSMEMFIWNRKQNTVIANCLGSASSALGCSAVCRQIAPGSLPCSFSVSLMGTVSLSATSATEVFEAKSLTDVEWFSDVHCIPPSAKGSREPDSQAVL